MKNYLDTAITAARAAGEIHKKFFKKEIRTTAKEEHFNRVSDADIEAEQSVISIIKKAYPAHLILAEEGGGADDLKKSEFLWVIDPLDGTNNFLHTVPFFSVSIALVRQGKPLLGVVYNPVQEELFHACLGQGAFLNGNRIKVSSNPDLKSALLSTGFYYFRDERMVRTLDNVKAFLYAGIIDIRRFGSAALDLCYVASGRLDGYWEVFLNPWDFAAGKIILEEAGGMVTNEEGKPLSIVPSSIVASNNKIHAPMLAVIQGQK